MHQPLIPITRKHALLFACFFVLYEFLTYIANDMIMPGMIKVVETFHAQESAIASSLTAYLLGGASLQLVLGPLSDRYGRRPVMLFGAVFFFLCTAVIACSTSIDQFLVARFLEGMGLCFICVIGYATLQEIFDEMDAIRLIAAMANVSVLAPLLGPLLGATCVYYFSWRFIFVAIAVCALFASWGLWRFMPEPVGQTTSHGLHIKRVPFQLGVIMRNYKKLLCNKTFLWGSVCGGLLGLPCVAWIGLSPVILITEGHISMIQYGVWQLPVFGAYIMGNVLLQFLTRRSTVAMMIWIGSGIASVGLLLMVILPYWMGNDYVWLIAGLITYFFGYGLCGGPLNRFILFSTPISKGTAAALMSMILMCIQAGGIELVNDLYATHSNVLFGLYCAVVGAVYFLVILGVFYVEHKRPAIERRAF